MSRLAGRSVCGGGNRKRTESAAVLPPLRADERNRIDKPAHSAVRNGFPPKPTVSDGERYITKSEEFSKEEEAVLKESNENFEAKALEFISSRVEANNSVISLSNLFLKRLIQRCILPGHKILSSVLQKLIRSGVDISVNPNILPAILDSRDLVTLLFYLQFASFISEPDLIKIWKYCLCANKFMVLQFAQDCKLTEKKHYKIRRR